MRQAAQASDLPLSDIVRSLHAPHPASAAAGARPRVTLLLGSLDGGGAERVAVNLARRCDPEAVDVRLALLRRQGAYLDEVEADRIDAAPARPGAVTRAIAAPADIAAMLRRSRTDVLMSFGLGVNMQTWLALQALGRRRPRWICREDNNLDAEIGGVAKDPVSRAVALAAARKVYRSADAFVAVAHELGDLLRRRVGFDDERLSVIHNPIDLAEIERRAMEPLPVIPMRPYVVTAGRMVWQKGFDVLIRAFAACPSAAGLDLVILGDGPLEADLRRLAAECGVAERVLFPGFQPNPWSWFARSSLFVLSSRWEGFGNVVAEAMACGAPALVTDCNYGPREQVAHGRSGWVAPAEDPLALASAMDQLLSQPDLTQKLAAAGRLRARAFDVDAIATAYTDLFLAQAGAPASAWPAPRDRRAAI
ncbi:MAG TPA: glycosyltransferase [Caulobacteraceae bacterium]|nr:glycosyltransferase [Caulobacteraceae bacterium]